jgi:hypothetical protein
VKKDCHVTTSPLLQHMLGFKRAIFPQGDHVADWVADVTRGLSSLYVYCPLAEPRMMGDAQVPLLRMVLVEGRDAEMVTRIFDPVVHVLSDNVFQRTRDTPFLPDSSSTRDTL